MALLRRLFLIPDGVPAPLRGAVAALIVLVAVLWPLTLLPAGNNGGYRKMAGTRMPPS